MLGTHEHLFQKIATIFTAGVYFVEYEKVYYLHERQNEKPI